MLRSTQRNYIHCIHCIAMHCSVFNFDYGEYLSKMNLNTHLISVVSLIISNVNFS